MPDKPVCFIIMPITTPEHMVPSYHNDRDHFQHVLEVLFTPAVEAAGYQMIPPNVDGSEVIQAEIAERLINSDLVLCDISGFNPNVFVELGMRTALNKPVALVRDSLVERLPFGTAILGHHEYDAMSAWKIPDEIKGLTEHLITVKDSGEDNSFWKYFGIRLSAQSPPESGAEEQLRAIIEILERQSKEPRIVLTPDVMRRLADAAGVRYAGSAAYRRYRLSRERGELTEPVPFEGMSGETTLSQQTDDEGNSVG